MFKVMNKLRSDKRGFTITELIVTLTIMLIALTLTGQLFVLIYKNYKIIEYRWMAQTIAQYLASSLQEDTRNETLGTADVADMMTDDITVDETTNHNTEHFSLASCPEICQIKFDPETAKITIRPSGGFSTGSLSSTDESARESALNKLKKYCYIYYLTLTHVDSLGNSTDHLYRVAYSDLLNTTTWTLNSSVEINPIGFDLGIYSKESTQADIGIDFSIARTAGAYDTAAREEDVSTQLKYLPTSFTANINVHLMEKYSRDVGATADMNISVYLGNMTGFVTVCFGLGL